ncbi:MAG: type VI secretion system tube protein Hcp [Rubrivivax sp.]
MTRSDMFLKATGQRTGEIVGESSDKRFPNQIDIIDWSWGMTAPTAVGGTRTGRVLMNELKLVKRVDKASTAMMVVMNTNEVLTSVVLSVRKSGGASPLPYFVITLTAARINSYEVQSDVDASGAPSLSEHLSLSFKSITVDYTTQSATGGSLGASSFTAEAAPSP